MATLSYAHYIFDITARYGVILIFFKIIHNKKKCDHIFC